MPNPTEDFKEQTCQVRAWSIGSCMVFPLVRAWSPHSITGHPGMRFTSKQFGGLLQVRVDGAGSKAKSGQKWAAAGAPGSCLAFILSRTARRCCCSSLLAF